MHLKIVTAILLLISPFCQAARDNLTCGIENGRPLENAYGPWDYINSNHQEKLPIVIKVHFTRDVATLKKGATGSIDHDIDYTLRAIPNYHPALYTAAKLERERLRKLKKGQFYTPKYYNAECYFKRAMYFQPKDYNVYMLYAMHLHLSKQYQASERFYLKALKGNPNHLEYHYNIALLYIDMNNIDKARKHADIAYAGGYPLSGLKTKLQALTQ